MRRIWQRRPRLGDDRGFTIVELLVASTIGMVILGSATLITIGAGRHNGQVANRTDATQRGRLAMERMTQLLRSQVCTTATATPVTNARTNVITFTSELSDGSRPVERHTFTFNASARTLTDAKVAGSGSPLGFTAAPVTTQLATDVVLSGTNPVFRYYAYPPVPVAGVPLEPSVEMTPPANGSLSATQLEQIARIDLNFVTTGATATTRSIRAEMTNRVFVRLSNPNAASSFNPQCA